MDTFSLYDQLQTCTCASQTSLHVTHSKLDQYNVQTLNALKLLQKDQIFERQNNSKQANFFYAS